MYPGSNSRTPGHGETKRPSYYRPVNWNFLTARPQDDRAWVQYTYMYESYPRCSPSH